MTKGRLLTNLLCLTCALLSCLAAPAFAANIAWKTASSGSWSIGTNWVGNQAPGVNDVAIITVAGTYDVNINSNVSVNAISLGSSARLRVNSVTLTTTTGIAVGSSSTLELNSGTLSGGGVSLNGKLVSSGISVVNVALTTATTTTIEVGAGSLTVANGFTNRGLLSFPATGTRNFYVTNGTLTNAASGTISCATTGLVGAVLDNQGSITATGGQGFLRLGTSGATHANSGSISAVSGAYLIFNGYGDTFNTSGSLSADALSILRVDGGVFHQTGGTISGSGNLELINTISATFASNPTTAVLYLAGHGIVFPSNLVNGSAQQVILGTGSDVTAPQLTNQVGYSLRVDEGVDALHVTTFFNLGTLLSPRYFLLDGNLNCGPLSNIEIGIGGPSIYWYDRIVVTGAAQLAGAIFFNLEGVFSPVPGDYFDVLSSPARIGLFDSVNGWDLGNDKYLVLDPLVTAADNRPYTVRTVRQKWIPLAPTGTPPPPRYGHSAVYVPASDRMIVFGGETGSGAASDLWVLDHAAGFNATPHWIQMTPTGTAPDPRSFHSAVYDVVNNRMIVYGGQNDNPGFYGDVWILANADGLAGTPAWEKFPDLPSPSPRSGHCAGYDPISNKMVMWGGEISCFGAYGDMWVLDHANGIGTTTGWSLWSVSGTPPPLRRDAAAAYDPHGNRLIVYGGKTPCQYGLSDASVLSNASGAPDVSNPMWHSLGAGASPALPGLNGAPGAYDPLFDRLVVFGGLENDISTFRSSVFLLADTHGLAGWTELPLPTTRPEGRAFHSMVYSPTIRRWIVFGGNANGTVVNDVWALELEGDAPQVSGIDPGVVSPGLGRHVLAFSASPSPNPASHGMQFSVRALGDVDGHVAVYDAMGRRVAELFNGRMPAGEHRFEWTDDVASGIYFVAVRSGDTQDVRRVVVAR